MTEQTHFEDVEPGDEFEEPWSARPEAVATFLDIGTQRMNRLGRFSSEEGARAVGLERPIVPGTMSFAVLTRVVTDWMGTQGRLHSIDVNFRRPITQGDELRALALVTDTYEEDGAGLVKLDVYMENDRGERPLQGVAVVELPRRGA